MEKKYILKCPQCYTIFDVEKEIVEWKKELLDFQEIIKKITELSNKISQKAGGKHDRKTSTEH